MTPQQQTELVRIASEARSTAYAPYSKYHVGAALIATSGRIFSGCNVENASYGLCFCAERTAIVKAVSEGETQFTAIAVATDGGGTPCGACRQFLAEFCVSSMIVIIHDVSKPDEDVHYTLEDLLPHAFRMENI